MRLAKLEKLPTFINIYSLFLITLTSTIVDIHHAPATTVASKESHILNTLSWFWIYTPCPYINVISDTKFYLLNI